MNNQLTAVNKWSIVSMILSAILVGCGTPFDRSRIVVQWTTGSEFNTAGFNVFRSETTDGVYVKINEKLIPAAPDPVAGGQYEFIDRGVASGKTYFYQLEEVEYSGVASRHGPIVAMASTSFDWQIGLIGVLIAGLFLLILGRSKWIHLINLWIKPSKS